MKPRRDSAPGPRFGSIRADEVLPLQEAARRMGWAGRMRADVQKMGLQTCLIGRLKYTTGRAVLQFVETMMQQQAGNGEGER